MRTVTIKDPEQGTEQEIEVIDYGVFEIEVGSPTYKRLQQQKLLPPGLTVDQAEDDEQVDLASLSVSQLRERCDELGIDHAGLKTKAKLIEAIGQAEDDDALDD